MIIELMRFNKSNLKNRLPFQLFDKEKRKNSTYNSGPF